MVAAVAGVGWTMSAPELWLAPQRTERFVSILLAAWLPYLESLVAYSKFMTAFLLFGGGILRSFALHVWPAKATSAASPLP
jgi:hypothetical protein